MPRNGSGTFSLAEPAFVSGNTISSTDVNTVLSDIATALTGSLAADGQKSASANQPMGGNKHTGVGDATNRTDYAAAGQIADGELTWAGVAGGTADALTLSLSPVITAYVTGMKIRFQASASPNTGATTVNVNSVGVKAVEINDAALTGGEIVANKYYEILYDGTAFQLSRVSSPGETFTSVVQDTTPQLGGALDTNGSSVNFSEGAAVASATAPDIWAGDGNTLHITGTTTITDFADAPRVGCIANLIFDDALTLTHGSGITLPGGANITTAAGDTAIVYADAVDAFRVIAYTKASGEAVVSSGGGWVLLSAQSASASASIDFDSLLTSTYDQYMLVVNAAIPATDDREAWLRFEQSSAYVSSSGAYQHAVAAVDAAAATTNTATGSSSDTEMALSLSGSNQAVGNGSNEGFDAVIYISSPSNTAVRKKIHGTCSYSRPQDSGLIMGNFGGQFIANTNAITGVQFLFESGNITSGEFFLYGLTKS